MFILEKRSTHHLNLEPPKMSSDWQILPNKRLPVSLMWQKIGHDWWDSRLKRQLLLWDWVPLKLSLRFWCNKLQFWSRKPFDASVPNLTHSFLPSRIAISVWSASSICADFRPLAVVPLVSIIHITRRRMWKAQNLRGLLRKSRDPQIHLHTSTHMYKAPKSILPTCSFAPGCSHIGFPSVQQNCKSQFLMMKGPLFSKHMLKPDPHNYIISRRPNQIVSFGVSALRQKSAQHFNSLDQKWKPESRIKPHQACAPHSHCPPSFWTVKSFMQFSSKSSAFSTCHSLTASHPLLMPEIMWNANLGYVVLHEGWKNPSGLQKPS